jgi:hypothetical protein
MKKIIGTAFSALLLLCLMACGESADITVPITWIDLSGPAPAADGTAELTLDFSEPVPELTSTMELNKIFSFVYYAPASDYPSSSVTVKAVSITPVVSVNNLYKLRVTGAPQTSGTVQVIISLSNVRPPDRLWALDGSHVSPTGDHRVLEGERVPSTITVKPSE